MITATPAAKKLAKSKGIKLETIKGTGNFGRITPDDVLIAAGLPPKASNWVANKRFEISKFKFKIPRARTSELQGSFSAVSKPNFASKYSLESSRRDLHNALLCTVL